MVDGAPRPDVLSAGVILHDTDRRVLLQHRDSGAARYPLHWSLFGGRAEGDENPIEAATREISEEIGLVLTPSVLEEVCVLKLEFQGELWQAHYFSTPLLVPVDQLHQAEGDTMGFFTEQELEGLKVVPSVAMVLEVFYESFRGGRPVHRLEDSG